MSAVDAIAIANRAQGAAIQPDVSVWVTASAGSGKTKVLTDRVLALLLAGTAPQRILCLTFTKAAAAEMNNRIIGRLAAWVTADDDALHTDLLPLTQGTLHSAAREERDRILARARRLFSEVLEAPGGLQISTLHAFCQSILRRFPLEARVPPHFALMDERDTAEALNGALEDTIVAARDGNDEALKSALAVVTARVHETNFADLMTTLVSARGKLKSFINGDIERAITAMRAALGLAAGEDEISLVEAACPDHVFGCDALKNAITALAQGTKTDQERGTGIAAWLAAPLERAARFEVYANHYLTKGEIRARLATKDVAAMPGVLDALQAEAQRLSALVARVKAARVATGTAALLRLGARVLDLYDDDKIRRGLMDYDDLIQLTRHLLAQPGVAEWVLYKLDGGIDHILIDEAQDTSPDQWAIVRPLRGEFFAGEGRHENRSAVTRTVFAVGDRKQSIYSFQGAAPEAFDEEQQATQSEVYAAGQRWAPVTMNVSFRSTPAVLTAVNAVFAQSGARDGVATPLENITHLAARDLDAGLVELWPLIEPQATDETVNWKPPVERRKGDSPQNRLAAEIAERIRRMVDDREILPSKARAIRPGDIMVLVRRRTGFVEELVRQLKKRGIAVAGVDRMVLTDQMAIMDLVALGRFLLLPEDDLTLAEVLKGPLVGLSEDELFILAYDRGEQHLWDVLSTHAGSVNRFGVAHRFLADLLARTDYLTPADLYGHILVTLDGRRKLLARLGVDADDPIDEFMNLALAYQQSHPPTLQGFLHWLAAGALEIKRDLEQSGADAVRVITVHGAKGLQAPIVFLPDTAQAPSFREQLLWTPDETPLPLWASKADDLDAFTCEVRDAAKLAQEREYRRLMYVAMTRAEDRLYVCGWQTKRPVKADEAWYAMIKSALVSLPQTETLGDGVLRLTSPQLRSVAPKQITQETAASDALPSWAVKAPIPEDNPPRPLAPSRAALTESAALSPLKNDGKQRYQRGLIIHRLLQSLPDLPPQRRRAAAEAFVKRPGWGIEAEAGDAIVTETLTVLDTAAFAPLFATGSRAEVSLTGLIGKYAVSGQIDRLAVTDSEVWIVDYKTNRPPPRDAINVDPAYVFQMATYRAALRAVYPQHTIRCALLWTDGPFIMELGDSQMDAVLQRTGLI
jgi:ATP-dependent helicase/nuclease subunit A